MEILEKTMIRNPNIILAISIALTIVAIVIVLDQIGKKYFKIYKNFANSEIIHTEETAKIAENAYRKYSTIDRILFPAGSTLAVLGILTTFILSMTVWGIDSGRYRYTAKFDDSISINEVYENYTNVRELEPGIYVFEDKE